jgi:hypothetical protein
LFPEKVRDQLFHINDDSDCLDGTGEAKIKSPKVNAPIAELYTDTTVLFAGKQLCLIFDELPSVCSILTFNFPDIANFTVWSSGKST